MCNIGSQQTQLSEATKMPRGLLNCRYDCNCSARYFWGWKYIYIFFIYKIFYNIIFYNINIYYIKISILHKINILHNINT